MTLLGAADDGEGLIHYVGVKAISSKLKFV